VVLADPHRYVGGFQGLVHDTGRVISYRVQVYDALPGRERGNGLVRVVATRLNRRSTISSTRRRTGLNSAAAASVEAATATGVWNRNTWVFSRTSPA
jgi:hypothetical protein